MTMTRPLRLMTLHFSQIGLTEGLTFISALPPFPYRYEPCQPYTAPTLHALFETIGDTATGQVVRGKLNRDLIARQDANEVHADLT